MEDVQPRQDPDPAAMNRASYDRIAPRWDEARTTFVLREREYLDTLLGGLAVPGDVLDLGCGTGRPMAEHVLARGHRLTGIDQSKEMLALARARFPHARWVHGRIEEHRFGQPFDAAISWDSLFHVERVHHARVFEGVYGCLRPGGRMMCTVGGSAHPAFTDTMFGEEFFYDSHPPGDVVAMLERIGFELMVAEFMNEPTGGRDRGRYAIVARRPG